jgi:hypothetical protein
MSRKLLTTHEAAAELGICRATLYEWLSQSDAGDFVVRGRPFTIEYFQGGRNGQGRIGIAREEIERLIEAMRAKPKPRRQRNQPAPQHFPHITAKLGRPAS